MLFIARRSLSKGDWARAAKLSRELARQKRKKDLSVQDISDKSGIPYQTVRALLDGKSAGPSFFLIVDLADALGLSVAALARATKRKQPPKKRRPQGKKAEGGRNEPA
ncbi:MAG: helix-turn-helix transcriptional regulator [bacterium]|nr:helix-turn-helix transcriptional regulator [bacterium]